MIKELIVAYALQDVFCVEAIDKLSKGKAEADFEKRIVCSMIIDEARRQQVRPIRALSVAWEESRFTYQSKPTRSRCIGPLQIKIKYWCKNGKLKNCNTIKDGVSALKHMIDNFKPIRKAYCYYNDSRKPACKTDYMSDYVKGVVKNYYNIKKVATKDEFKSLKVF